MINIVESRIRSFCVPPGDQHWAYLAANYVAHIPRRYTRFERTKYVNNLLTARQEYLRSVQMAENGKQRENIPWKGFVRGKLDKVLRTAASQHFPSVVEMFAAVDRVIQDGYKVSLSRDTANDSIVATLFCRDPHSAQYGYSLTSRAATCEDALTYVLYRHLVVLEGDWPLESGTGEDVFG